LALDAELQAYLADYLKRPRVEAAAATSRTEEAQVGNGRFADMKDDLPWTDDEISRAKAAAEEKEEVPF
jgi:hypothetical protein